MADVYATIASADEAVQENLADVIELRAADAQQRAMLDEYLGGLELPDGARVLELGSGTGAICRVLRQLPGVAEVVGVDPSPVFVERARALAGAVDGLSFEIGDARRLDVEEASFDAVVCHTALCHIPEPERVLAEARRVAAPGAVLAVFDGDYATTSVAIRDDDPLQACAEAAIEALVHDRWLVRRLEPMVRAAGWNPTRMRSHGYLASEDPRYMLTIVDRGADALVAAGSLEAGEAESLKGEARRRIEAGEFFGQIAYASLIALRT
jgi:ubiquinone/menaquinone biosynthesis C-methylase UbiE